MGEDVIGSGPDRLESRRPARFVLVARRLVGRLTRLQALADPRRRRVATAALAATAAVLALVALRTSAPQARPAAAGGSTSRTAGSPLATVPTAPFDMLPGRTPIPAPSLIGEDGQTIGGEIPLFAPAPSEAAVRIAVKLILNRFCRDPDAHAIRLEPGAGESWRSATAIVRQQRGLPLAHRPVITLRLLWTGYTYRWRGSLDQLTDCG